MIEGNATFSKIEIFSNISQSHLSISLLFDEFNAEKCQLGVRFEPSWDAGPDSISKLSAISKVDAQKADAKSHEFSFKFDISSVVSETPVFKHFNEWAVVACPTFNQLCARSECLVIPYSIESRYLVLKNKIYPVDLSAPQPKKHLLVNFMCAENHTCSPYTFPSSYHSCDLCRESIPRGCPGLRCKQCDYDICNNCKDSRCDDGETENASFFHHKLCSCQLIKCKNDHTCDPVEFNFDTSCDKCGGNISEGSSGHKCRSCSYDVCEQCSSSVKLVASKLQLRACFDQTCFECKIAAPMFSYFCEKCGSCIPPRCVFMNGEADDKWRIQLSCTDACDGQALITVPNPGSSEKYPFAMSLEAGSIQRYRAIKLAVFETFPVGSEVMITVPKTEVFESSEVLKVVSAEHTQHGPYYVVQSANECDQNLIIDENLLGCTRMERLSISSLQQLTDGTLNKNGGVFVEGSRFMQSSVDKKYNPPCYVGTVIQDTEKKRFYLEWPLVDCLYDFKMSRPRLLVKDDEATQKVDSEKQSIAKRQSPNEDLKKLIDKKEHFFGEKGVTVPFFDVLVVGDECHVYEVDSAKPKPIKWDLPLFTIIRCIGTRFAKEKIFQIAPREHQLCSEVSELMIAHTKVAEDSNFMNRVKKTGVQQNQLEQQQQQQKQKQQKPPVFGLKLKVEAENKKTVGSETSSKDAFQDAKAPESLFFADEMNKNFLCEKETPLTLKFKGKAFTMAAISLQCFERATEESIALKETKPFQLAVHAQFIKQQQKEIIVKQRVDDFDIDIDFCREIGEYFQVKRFSIQHKATKYTIGVIFDSNGNWIEVHGSDSVSRNNENELQCFVEHPLSDIISKNYQTLIVFTVIAIQGKHAANFLNQVETWIKENRPKHSGNVFCRRESERKESEQKESELKECEQKESEPKESEKKESGQKEAESVLLYFSSLKDANESKVHDSFQIKKVTVDCLPADRTSRDNKSEVKLYFVNMLSKTSAKLFSHRTELEYEKREPGVVVPQLEYSAPLLPYCKFQLQVSKYQYYTHPVAAGVPNSLEQHVYFIFFENFKGSGKIQHGKWKYAQVVSPSKSRIDGHVVIQEIDCNNQRGPLRALKLWLVECKNPNCQNQDSLNSDCKFFHFAKPGCAPSTQWIDDYCPKSLQCSNPNCGLNHQKPRKIVSSVLSFQILSKPLIFPSSKSDVVFLKPNVHQNSEYFLKGFLRPWLPGRVVGVDIGKQIYKVKPLINMKTVPETKKIFSAWANEEMFAAFCESKIEIHYASGLKIEVSNPGWSEVLSFSWISSETKIALAYGCADGNIRIFIPKPGNLKHPEEQELLQGHFGAVTCIYPIISSTNKTKDVFHYLPSFASGSADCDIRLWHKISNSWQSQVCITNEVFKHEVILRRFFAFTNRVYQQCSGAFHLIEKFSVHRQTRVLIFAYGKYVLHLKWQHRIKMLLTLSRRNCICYHPQLPRHHPEGHIQAIQVVQLVHIVYSIGIFLIISNMVLSPLHLMQHRGS
jgi:hypothetical protein